MERGEGKFHLGFGPVAGAIRQSDACSTR